MNIIVSIKSDKPIYEQIYEQIASQILNGELEANFCLPSIRTIAKDLQISVITVKKTYEMLESEGLIYTRQGVGCYVSELAKQHLSEKKFDLAVSQLRKDITYYKNLNITLDELISFLKKEYKD